MGENVYEVRDAKPPAATEPSEPANDGERLFVLRYDRQALPAPARTKRQVTLLPGRASAWLDGMKHSAKSLIPTGTSSRNNDVLLPLPRPLPAEPSELSPELPGSEADTGGRLAMELEAAFDATERESREAAGPVRFPSSSQRPSSSHRKAVAAIVIAGMSLGIGALAVFLSQSEPVAGTAMSDETAEQAAAASSSPSRSAGSPHTADRSTPSGISLFENEDPPMTRGSLASLGTSERGRTDDPFAAGPKVRASSSQAGRHDRHGSADRLASATTTSPTQPGPTRDSQSESPSERVQAADASNAADNGAREAAREAARASSQSVPSPGVLNGTGAGESAHADASPRDAAAGDSAGARNTATSTTDAAATADAAAAAAAAAAASGDARTTFFLLDASGSMVDRLPQALDALRERVEVLDRNERFLVVLFNGHGLSFVPALGAAPATEGAQAEAMAFLQPDRIDAFGRGDRMEALLFAIAHADARDKIVLLTDPSHFAGDPEGLYDRVAHIMAGCDLRISTVQFYDGELDVDLERIAEEFGGEHSAIHPESVADAGGLSW